MAGNLPRLFESTKILPEGGESGLDDAPEPDEVEYASPDRAGIDANAAEAGEESLAEPEPRAAKPPVADPDSESADAAPAAPARRKGDYSNPENDEPEGEAEAAASAAAEAGDFSDDLLKQAERYGIDAESARRYGTGDNLKWAMAERDRLAAEWSTKQIAAMTQQQQPPAQQFTQQQPPAPPQQQQTPTGVEFPLSKEELLAKGFDEDAVDVLNKMNEHWSKQFEQLQQQPLAAQQQQVTSDAHAEAMARAYTFGRELDAFFEKLGPEWEPDFGKGPMLALTANEQKVARDKLAATVLGLELADAQSNQPPQSYTELAQRAFNALHFKKQQELDRKALAAKVTQRRSQAIARPGGSRTQAESDPRMKAVKRSQDFDRKFSVGNEMAGMY